MKTLREEVEKGVENWSLSFEEVKRVLSGRVPNLRLRFVYEPSHNFKNLWRNKVNVCFILLELGEMKHWCVLGKKPSFFFDPLGNPPEFFKESWPKLFPLIDGLDWNNHAFEKTAKNINDCGSHCIIRSAKFHLTNDQYFGWINSVLPGKADFLVSLMVYLGTRNFIKA